MHSRPDLSRRTVLGGLAALSVGGLLGACGTDDAARRSESSGSWTYTDDLGQKISLGSRPRRIAGYGDEVAALWNFGIEPVALFHYVEPSKDAVFEGRSLSGVDIVGTAYGELDLEKLAAAEPDLIVTTAYAADKPELLYGFKDETQMKKVRQIAPVLAVKQVGSALDVIASNKKLAAALGADVRTGRVARDQADFEKAATTLTAASRDGLSVIPMYAEQAGGAYYAKAPDDPALKYYQELGVRFTPVGGKEYYWDQVSWENVDRYTADIVLYSLRDSLTPTQLQDQPTFARLPAARAGQLHPWKFKSMDYPSQAAYMRELAGWLTSDRKVV